MQSGEHTASTRPVPFLALRHRDFRLFWGGLVLSGTGSQFTAVAMAWQIYELTNSPLQIGLLGLARAVPQMALLLFGGLLADAVDRRRLMMAMQVGQFAVSGFLAALAFAGLVSPPVLYMASVFLAVFGSLENPARQALVPNLVPRSELTSAVALNATQRNVSQIAGPALAGIVLGGTSAAFCYAVDAISWLLMLGALAVIAAPAQAASGRRGISLQSLGEGVGFVWRHPVVLSLTILDFAQNVLGSPRALMPVYARDILFVGPEGLGLLYAATSAGSVGAAALMTAMPQVRRAGLWVLIGVGIYAVSTMLFAVSHVFWFSLAMLAIEGIGNTVSTILRGTMNQLVTPDDLRGRVTSVNNVFTNGGPQLGQFRAGAVGEVIGGEGSALGGGAALLAVVALVAALARPVREFRIDSASVPAAARPG